MTKVVRLSEKTLNLLEEFRKMKVEKFLSEPYNEPVLAEMYNTIGEDQLIWEALYQILKIG